MEARRRALGRGLGALIPVARSPAESGLADTTSQARLDAILPNPYQPRANFTDETIDELAASIRQKGLLQPLLVRRVGQQYQLIAGERRFRAAQRAGLTHVPVTVREADDREALELALIENLQRENLNPIEEARAYKRLCDEFGLTQDEVALRVGKNRSTITNSLRLLQLPREVRDQIEAGALSAGHARSLLGLESAKTQNEVARDIIRRRLSVRQTEALVRRKAEGVGKDLDQQALENALARALGTKVRLHPTKNGAGKIEIAYYSLAELSGLVERLTAR